MGTKEMDIVKIAFCAVSIVFWLNTDTQAVRRDIKKAAAPSSRHERDLAPGSRLLQ